MNLQHYKQRLLELESELSARTERETGRARAQATDSVSDVGDASVADESVSENLTKAELDSSILRQVRDALRRTDDGTFGTCIVDGGPIEAKRLEALPWTPYCLKHQEQLETAARLKTPTL